MPKFFTHRSKKSGLPPGTPVHIGKKQVDQVSITLIDYDENKIQQAEIESVNQCFPFTEKPTVTWINIEGLHDVDTIKNLGDHFGLHPLVQEDIVHTDQRPKLEIYDGYLYIVLKMLHTGNEGITGEQISFILGSNFVLSFQEGSPGDAFSSVRERLLNSRGHIREMGADYLVYALIDAIVDNYFLVLEQYGEQIELLEEEALEEPTPQTLHTIHRVKREMIFLRKAIWPVRELVNRMERGDSELIQNTTRLYLRDVYDHTIQVIEAIELFRDMLSSILDIYLSSISNRMNEVMKVLTIYATIFIPLTFIVGVYGMNFEYMPELKIWWAYPLLWLIMLGVAGSLLVFFRRKKWL
ncbi:MAG: magnesium/cobalt transporter CorA [bacterium]|nr:magnesium/cobalt transporter CorA [bacterium]